MNATFACIPRCLDQTILWNIKICLFIVVSNFWKAPVSTMYFKLVSRHPPPFVLIYFRRFSERFFGVHRLVRCLGTTFNLPLTPFNHPVVPFNHPPTRFCLSFLSLVSNTWRVGEAPLLFLLVSERPEQTGTWINDTAMEELTKTKGPPRGQRFTAFVHFLAFLFFWIFSFFLPRFSLLKFAVLFVLFSLVFSLFKHPFSANARF